jgi:hypothetical protein
MEVPTGLTAVNRMTDSPATMPIAMMAPRGAPTLRIFRGNGGPTGRRDGGTEGFDTRAA